MYINAYTPFFFRCTYMYMYIHTYTYIKTCMHACIAYINSAHAYVCVHVYVYVRVCMCICICIGACIDKSLLSVVKVGLTFTNPKTLNPKPSTVALSQDPASITLDARAAWDAIESDLGGVLGLVRVYLNQNHK